MKMTAVTRPLTALLVGAAVPLIAPAPAHAVAAITFELTGTFTEGVMVSYFGEGGAPQVATVGLPWSTSFDYDGDMKSLIFSGTHPGEGSGSITCKVSVNGRTLVSHTNNTPAQGRTGASCNIVNLGNGYIGN